MLLRSYISLHRVHFPVLVHVVHHHHPQPASQPLEIDGPQQAKIKKESNLSSTRSPSDQNWCAFVSPFFRPVFSSLSLPRSLSLYGWWCWWWSECIGHLRSIEWVECGEWISERDKKRGRAPQNASFNWCCAFMMMLLVLCAPPPTTIKSHHQCVYIIYNLSVDVECIVILCVFIYSLFRTYVGEIQAPPRPTTPPPLRCSPLPPRVLVDSRYSIYASVWVIKI